MTTVTDAYQHCERVTREQARNFSYGIRLLPPPKRRALSAIYAYARRIDDIGDGDLPREQKLSRLAGAREELRRLDGSTDPVLLALGDAARRYPVPVEAFGELIDGCEADVRDVTYETFADLHRYCRQVAGSIGRLSLGVFDPAASAAADGATAAQLADDLGVALQLTNILRDVREDRLTGRVYVPAEDLRRFGVRPDALTATDGADDAAWVALVGFEVQRTEGWYGRGLGLLRLLDRRSTACTAAMAGIYHRLLHRIAADPAATRRERVRVPGWEKAVVAARALATGAA